MLEKAVELKDPRTPMGQMLAQGIPAKLGDYDIVVPEITLAQIESLSGKFVEMFSAIVERIEGASEKNIGEILTCIPMLGQSIREFLADVLLHRNSRGVCLNPDLPPEAIGDALQSQLMDILIKFMQINPSVRYLAGKHPALRRLVAPESAPAMIPRA